MADSISQQIMDAIGVRLQTILIAGGYNTNAGQNVFIDRITPLIESELPGIVYRDPDEDYEESGMTIGQEGKRLKVEIQVIASGATAIKDIRNKLIPDVRKAIPVGETWNGIADYTRIISRTIQAEYQERLIANATIRFEIDYRELI